MQLSAQAMRSPARRAASRTSSAVTASTAWASTAARATSAAARAPAITSSSMVPIGVPRRSAQPMGPGFQMSRTRNATNAPTQPGQGKVQAAASIAQSPALKGARARSTCPRPRPPRPPTGRSPPSRPPAAPPPRALRRRRRPSRRRGPGSRPGRGAPRPSGWPRPSPRCPARDAAGPPRPTVARSLAGVTGAPASPWRAPQSPRRAR